MILYHGTSNSNAAVIQYDGLKPRTDIGNWAVVPSINKFVYLTGSRDVACFYAANASLRKNEKYAYVIEVEVDEDNLYPDENLFLNGDEYISAPTMMQAQALAVNNQDLWEDSLRIKRLVMHKGEIPVEKINSLYELSGYRRNRKGNIACQGLEWGLR